MSCASIETTTLCPELESVTLGALTVWLCPKDAGPSAAQLEKDLPAAELAAAAAIRAPERHREFLVGRWLYHTLTKERAPLLKSEDGTPLWPAHLRGSITHKSGHVAFAFLGSHAALGVGIDLEDIGAMKTTFATKICRDDEAPLINGLAQDDEAARKEWLALMFSFKESLFKAHYPAGRTFFYFHDARISAIDPATRRIEAEIMCTTGPQTPSGHSIFGHYAIWEHLDRRFMLSAVVEAGTEG